MIRHCTFRELISEGTNFREKIFKMIFLIFVRIIFCKETDIKYFGKIKFSEFHRKCILHIALFCQMSFLQGYPET